MIETIISAVSVSSLVALAAFIVIRKRNTVNIMLSLLLLLISLIELIDQLSVHLSYDPVTVKRFALFIESLLPASLLYLSLTYARQITKKSIPIYWWGLIGLSVLFPLSPIVFPTDKFFYSPDLQIERMLFLGDVGYWFYMGLMVYCILALMNVEATFSATSGSDRWRIKFEVIGIMSILGILIFYYSQGLLYRSINMNLIPARSGVFIISAFLIGYSRVFRGDSVRITVSRYILYRSLTLLAVGFYLLILGLIGEGLRYFSVSFSKDLTIFIAFAMGIGMVIIFLSGRIRRKAAVIVSKHFYRHKRDYRDEWLKFTELLSSCKTTKDIFDAILTTYRATFGLRGSSLYLIDQEKKIYKRVLTHNMSGGEHTLNISPALFSYFVDRGRVFNSLDNEYNPLPEEAFFVRKTGAWLIVPLAIKREVIGFVVLGEQIVSEDLTYEDYDLMKTLARQASLAILNFRLLEELSETREITAVAKISSFIIHDLKNLTSNLSLLLDNAENYIRNPEFQTDMIETIKNTLNKMKNLIQKLKTIPEKRALNIELADINILIREVIDELTKTRQSTNIIYHGSSVMSEVDAEEIKKIVLNLILNALDAIDEKGIVEVETGINGENIYIRIKDNGCGMTEEFIYNNLFKPFRTTKKKGLGIGLYQCKQVVEAHSGRIEINSEAGKGSVFTVYLPVTKETEYVT